MTRTSRCWRARITGGGRLGWASASHRDGDKSAPQTGAVPRRESPGDAAGTCGVTQSKGAAGWPPSPWGLGRTPPPRWSLCLSQGGTVSPAVLRTPRGSLPLPFWWTCRCLLTGTLGSAVHPGRGAAACPLARGVGPQVGIRPRVAATSLVRGEDGPGRGRSPWGAMRAGARAWAGGERTLPSQLHPRSMVWWRCPGGTPAQGSPPIYGYPPDTASTPPSQHAGARPPQQGPAWPRRIPAGIRYRLLAAPCRCGPDNPFGIVPTLRLAEPGCPGDVGCWVHPGA